MKPFKSVRLIGLAAVIAIAAGCGGDGSSESDDGNAGVADTSQEFADLVSDLFASTSDSTDPVEINDFELRFNDQDNPSAFDDLLS